MVKSMTGFGKTTCKLDEKEIDIEIRSLNSKFLEFSLRLPFIYKACELDIKKKISKYLERGKVEVSFYENNFEQDTSSKINTKTLKSYFQQLKPLINEFDLDNNNLINAIIKLPNTIETKKKEVEKEDWDKIMEALMNAIKQTDKFRTQEGKTLEKEVISNITKIQQDLEKIDNLDQTRVEKIKKNLIAKIESIQNNLIDKNRLEQELIYYIEKIDITEEKVRLKNHCSYFLETLNNKETQKGKKLNFISQEIGREINTIGSKANDDKIQKLVVEMKDELEKIKEQCLNIL